MTWNKIISLLMLTFLVSATSSTATWLVLNRKKTEKVSWTKILSLTPDQAKQFTAFESELDSTLKELETEDAQNKIFLCSYLDSMGEPGKDMKAPVKKMGEVYEKKQEKIANAFASISGILTPEQRKIFSHRLMQEVCMSCRKATKAEKCLCGMCNS